MLRKPKSSDICPPGYHVVRSHERVCHSGTKTWVDEHIAKNPGKKIDMLLQENLLYLYWNADKKYPKLNSIKGFSAHEELDSVIQFWLDYWKQKGLDFPKTDALLVKALIAVESGFNLKADPKVKGSSAYGLMQLTNQARHRLEGVPDKNKYREVRSNYLRISREDMEDPVVAIAAGTRWLSYKYSKIPRGSEKNVFNMIKNYYSWNEDGEEYAKKVIDLYEKSK